MKLICIYANYAAYNNNALRPLYNKDAPIVYAMADTALLTGGKPFFVPDCAAPCTCGAQLAVRISRLGRFISPRFARRYYDAFTVCATFTAENLFARCVSEGLPWEVSKGFDGAACVGRPVLLEDRSADAIGFRLDIDGREVQRGNTANLLRNVDTCIAYVSRFYTLRQGDLLFTGTPLPDVVVEPGCHVDGYADGQHLLSFNIR